MIATALQIIDEDGAEALSMRALAQRLDSGTATLYRHFPGRAGLIAGVIDRVFGEVDFSAEEFATLSWQQALQAVARAMFGALSRHRNVAPLLAGEMQIGPHAMAVRERCLEVLLRAGFPPQLAARSYATVARYVLGFAIQLGAQPTGQYSSVLPPTAFRPAQFPATATVAGFLPVPLEEEFDFGLELLIRGLTGACAEPGAAQP